MRSWKSGRPSAIRCAGLGAGVGFCSSWAAAFALTLGSSGTGAGLAIKAASRLRSFSVSIPATPSTARMTPAPEAFTPSTEPMPLGDGGATGVSHNNYIADLKILTKGTNTHGVKVPMLTIAGRCFVMIVVTKWIFSHPKLLTIW